MDFKTGKLHKVIKEFQKGSGNYEINGIDLKNTVFLYREKASPFIPIPKGNYRTVFNDNESTLIVDDEVNNKAVEFQVISVFDIQASKYLEKFPELKILVEHTNKIVDDINNIIEYLNSVGIKADSKFQTQILTPLEPSSTWYMNADGIIDTLPIDDFNKKFKEIIEKISETVDIKAKEQVQEKLEILKTEIEAFKNIKTDEIIKNIKNKEDTSLKEIEKIKDIVKNEITKIGNNSKQELESKMPEINNKLNGIAGGQINPSFIQDVGEKRIGEYYLDKNTGKLFRCVRTTSNIINSSEYFKDMSIDSVVNKLENLYTNVIELGKNITKSTKISTLKDYKFWKVELIISNIPNQVSHQRYVFTVNSTAGFSYNDNFNSLGLYAIDINKDGNIILSGSAIDKGFIKINIFGIY